MIQGPIDILTKYGPLQDLIGSDKSGKYKVYPVRYPQKEGTETTLDKYLVVYKTAGQYSLGKGCGDSLRQSGFNVNIYAANYEWLDNIFEAVVKALDGQEGIHKDIEFISIDYTTDYDAFDDQSRLYIRVVSFVCQWTAPGATAEV